MRPTATPFTATPLTATPLTGTLRRYLGEHGGHAHEHAQLLFGVAGRLELEVEGRALRVDAESGLIVPAGCVHAYEATAPASVWVLDVPDGDGLDRLRRFALPGATPRMRPDAELLNLARTAPRALAARPLDPAQLEAAVAGRLHEDWPVARLAAVYALSAVRFHARWLARTGRTPAVWLREQRLVQAERWLRAGRTLEVTALAVGYGSASALAQALRRRSGRGARDLRR